MGLGSIGTSATLGVGPGKRPLTNQVQQVQRRDATSPESLAPDVVHEVAQQGVSGTGTTLPFHDQIQAAFGEQHDLTNVQAHIGGAAADASATIGAEAYATGQSIAFRKAPDLHTAAHEAAHIVQQRAGVHLKGGVGVAGDAYEQHADQVADRVVAGASAGDLLGAASCACGSCETCTQKAASTAVQLDPTEPAERPAPERDPNDLTGTKFEPFDSNLKHKLVECNFKGEHPTLEAALTTLTNVAISSMARVASTVSAIDPALWGFIRRINGGWITDNWGMGVTWDEVGVAAHCIGSGPKAWCKDNPTTAKIYHGTENSYRRVTAGSGPGLHVIINGGGSDVHVDAHQPVDKKDEDGSCCTDSIGWISHAWDVAGPGGAKSSPIGRYGRARDQINRKVVGPLKLGEAKNQLDMIADRVTVYAANGKREGETFEGDRLMLADRYVMERLETAERMLS